VSGEPALYHHVAVEGQAFLDCLAAAVEEDKEDGEEGQEEDCADYATDYGGYVGRAFRGEGVGWESEQCVRCEVVVEF